MKRDFQKTVQSWDNKPTFTIQYSAESVTVGTDDELYALVNDGAPAHQIAPRRASRLRFMSDYKAKTTPGVIGSKRGGPGGSVINLRNGQVVMHPGFEARNFVDAIREKNERTFIQKAIDAIIQANR